MANKINRKKRIITDLQRLREPPEPHLPKYDIRQEKANDLNVIYTEIRGPEDSYYSGGYFVIRFEFTNDYPVSSPSVAFATKIWHPNVDHNSGSVCLNSLNQNWQPTVNVRHILDTHMPWLLKHGNPDDPLNTDAGTQMKQKDDKKYENTVKQWVKKFASKSQLHSVGSVWYKDQPKKKKKKKKFNIAELTKDNNNNSTPKINNMNDLSSPKQTRKPSKSVGNIDDIQDWWTQSKILPNTPSKSGKPQIIRSHSFCVRPDSSPWNNRQLLRRNTTEPYSDYNENNNNNDMKLICLYDEDETNEYSIPSKVPLKKKQKLNNNNNNNIYNKRRRFHKVSSLSLNENDSGLSSMDEDPIYDLQTYQSLTSFDIQSISCSKSQTPSYNYTKHNNNSGGNKHINSGGNKHINNSNSNSNNNNKYYNRNDIYSKSDGFMPQINSFICPEFSPLSPAKTYNTNYEQTNERILHITNHTNNKNKNKNKNKNNNDGNDTDIISDNDDDDDIAPTPNNNNNHINTIKNNDKIKHKLVDIDIDIDMNDSKSKNVLISSNDSKKMSLD